MRDPLHSVSVANKLALMFASVCLLAFGVGGVLVSRSARQALESEIHTRLDYQARAYSDSLAGSLRLLGRRSEDFASDGYLRSRLESLATDVDVARAQQLRDELRAHLSRNKLPLVAAFLDLALLDGRGVVVTTVRRPRSPALTAVSGRGVLPDQTWFSDLFGANKVDAVPTFAIVTPLRDLASERTVGHLVALVHSGVWIAQALGRPGEISETGRDEVVLELFDRSDKGLRVPPEYSRPPGIAPDSDLVQSGFGLEIVAGIGAAQEVGHAWFTHSQAIAVNGWDSRVRVNAESALLPVAGLQSRFLGYGALLTLGAALLLFFPIRFLARPLRDLSNAARRVRDGDLGSRVTIDSEDEIGELGRSFNLMTEALEERTTRLLAERDRLDTVIRTMRDGLLVLNADGEVELSNQAARPLLNADGTGHKELASHHVCRDSGDEVISCAGCLFDPEKPSRSCVIDLGSTVYEVHSTQLPPGADGRHGKLLVSRDMTDRIAEDERHIHQERLAVMGEVAAVMAHELNNPLAAISMFNQMLAAEMPEASPLRENVDVIQRNTDTCKRTIRELLDYATGAVPEVGAVDLHATLEEVASFLRPIADRVGVEWVWHFEAADSEATADEIQLRQVFVNLFMNAIQAMSEGGGTLDVRTRDVDGYLEIDVADSGPGIPAADQGKIFRPFFTTKARGSGTGLGLPTAKRIAEMHGGSLELARTGPEGTTFRVRIRRRMTDLLATRTGLEAAAEG